MYHKRWNALKRVDFYRFNLNSDAGDFSHGLEELQSFQETLLLRTFRVFLNIISISHTLFINLS